MNLKKNKKKQHKKHHHHHKKVPVGHNMVAYRPDPVKSPWAAEAPKATWPMFTTYDNEMPIQSGYSRVMPDQFTQESDDRLMNSIIGAYAVEGNNEGTPTGNFYLTKAAGKNIAKEVVQTHLGFTGKKRDDYVKENFPDVWGKLDVNNDGFIADQMGTTLTRMMVGDVELNNGLQL